MATSLAPEQLRAIPIFDGLSDAELATISQALHPVEVPAQTNLIAMEQPGDVVYLILQGTVKVFVEEIDGKEVILALLGAGEVVGEMSLVDNLTRSASVTTLEASLLARMGRASFWQYLQSSPRIATNMVRILSRRLRLADSRIRASATLDVEGRVALQLLVLAQELGEPNPEGGIRIPIRLSQHDLAALVGASRVRVNQILVDYRERGLVTIDRHLRVTLLDREALARHLDEGLLTTG